MRVIVLALVFTSCIALSQCAHAATCPETKVINKTNEWTETDQKNLEFTQKRCEVHYEDSPCLKKFEKYDFQAYRATCGPADQAARSKK